MFELLTGKHAMVRKGEDKSDYRRRMNEYQGISFEKCGLSGQAIDLLSRLTHPKVSNRMTAEQALAHPWLCIDFVKE